MLRRYYFLKFTSYPYNYESMVDAKSGKTVREICGIAGVLVLLHIGSNYSNGLLLEVFDLEKANTTILFLNRLLLWGILLLFFLYVKFFIKEKFLPWEERKQTIVRAGLSVIILLVILFVGFVGLILFIQYLDFPTQGERLPEINILFQNLHLMIFYAFTAGVLEELLFRGYILPTLTRISKSLIMGILISSTIFGLMHFSYGTVHQVIIPTFFGIVFATYYAKFRSLTTIILCHFIWNFVVYLDSANLL